jgi:predicted RNA-binding protein Jag
MNFKKRTRSLSRQPRRSSPRYNRRRSRSGQRSVVVELGYDDVAFVLGKQGVTKRKLERVSGAIMDINECELTITGTDEQIRKAKEYSQYVLQQRVGDVRLDVSTRQDDLSVVNVPEEAVAFVMGRGGQFLRNLEEEWGTLMFFVKSKASSDKGRRKRSRSRSRSRSPPESQEVEQLAIFGPRRSRRGAELKVMSAVEHKMQGWFLTGSKGEQRFREKFNQPGDDADSEEWGYETLSLNESEFSYALGARGSTRLKLAAASACVLEYVGFIAVMCGSGEERRRARDYIGWLLDQRNRSVRVDTRNREDCLAVKVPRESMGFITGHKGASLREIEHVTKTFCFANGSDKARNSNAEELLIFGSKRNNRERARDIVLEKVDIHTRNGGRSGRNRRSRSRDRRASSRRSRSPHSRARSPHSRPHTRSPPSPTRTRSPRNRTPRARSRSPLPRPHSQSRSPRRSSPSPRAPLSRS